MPDDVISAEDFFGPSSKASDPKKRSKMQTVKDAMAYDVSGAVAQKTKKAAASANEWSKKYTPTFRAAAIGGAKALPGIARGTGRAASGAWSYGKDILKWGASGFGFAGGMDAENIVKVSLPAGLWIFAGLLVWAVDWIFGFNGIDAVSFYQFISMNGFSELRNIINGSVIIILLVVALFQFIRNRRFANISAQSIVIFIIVAIGLPFFFAKFPGFNYFSITSGEIIFFLILLFGGMEMFSMSLLIIMIFLIITHGGISPGNVAHVAFAFFFYFIMLRGKMDDKVQANLWMITYLAIDYFAFSLLGQYMNNSIIANRLFLPIPFLFAVFFTYDQQKIGITKFTIFAVMLFYILYSFTLVVNFSDLSTRMDEAQKAQAIDAFKVTWDKTKSLWTSFKMGALNEYNRTITTARGDYYTAQVDAKATEKLGVFLEDLKPFSASYAVGDQVLVDGKLIARAIDEEVKITKLDCYSKYRDKANQEQKIQGKMDPAIDESHPLNILASEQDSLTCTIPEDPQVKFEAGSQQITVSADFDFVTSSYLLTYYTNRDRYRDMLREDIDFFKQYGINVQNPVAVYTSGPMNVGIGIRGPIAALDTTTDNELPLSIILDNAWEGKMTNLLALFIILPKGETLKADDGGTYCFGYTVRQDSCSSLSMYFTNSDKWCSDSDFNVYSFDTISPQSKKLVTSYDQYIKTYGTIRCKMIADATQLLGQTPYQGHYSRILTKYTYRLEKQVTVNIKKPELTT